MKTANYRGSVASAYGRELPQALTFDFTVEEFTNADEIREAGEWPKDSEIVDFVNNKRKNNERTKAQTQCLTDNGVEKPDLKTDVQEQLKQLIRIYKIGGKSEDEAIQIAEQTLGATYQR